MHKLTKASHFNYVQKSHTSASLLQEFPLFSICPELSAPRHSLVSYQLRELHRTGCGQPEPRSPQWLPLLMCKSIRFPSSDQLQLSIHVPGNFAARHTLSNVSRAVEEVFLTHVKSWAALLSGLLPREGSETRLPWYVSDMSPLQPWELLTTEGDRQGSTDIDTDHSPAQKGHTHFTHNPLV